MGNKNTSIRGANRHLFRTDEEDIFRRPKESHHELSKHDCDRMFQPSELSVISAMFKELEQKDHTMDKSTFLRFFKVPGMLGERLFHAFDSQQDGAIDLSEFIQGLSMYVRGTKEQRSRLLFEMYDLNDDGTISKEELSMMLHSLVNPALIEDQLLWFEQVAANDEAIEKLQTSSRHSSRSLTRNASEFNGSEYQPSANVIAGVPTLETSDHLLESDDNCDGDIDSAENIRIRQLTLQLHDPYEGPINVIHEVNMAANIGVEQEKWVVGRIVSYAFDICSTDTNKEVLSFENFLRWLDHNPCVLHALEAVFSNQCWADPRTRQERSAGLSANMPTSIHQQQHTSQNLLCDHCGFACLHCHLCGSDLTLSPEKTHMLCSNTTTGVCGTFSTLNMFKFCIQCGKEMQIVSSFNSNSNLTTPSDVYSTDFRRLQREVISGKNNPKIPGISRHNQIQQQTNSNNDLITLQTAQSGTSLSPSSTENTNSSISASHSHAHTTTRLVNHTNLDMSHAFDMPGVKHITFEGMLYKRSGSIMKAWKHRWALVTDGFMYFFKERDDSDAMFILFLEGCFIELADDEEHSEEGYFGFEVITKTHKHIFYAKSAAERRNWIRILRKAAKTQSIEEFYDMKKPIGKGKFAVIFEAVHKFNGRSYAIKIVSKGLMENDGSVNEALRAEMAILKLMSHPNIIHLKEVFEDHHNIYIVMPLIRYGDLFDRIMIRKVFSEQVAKSIVWKLLSALDYLHERGIIHRDLKPENILMLDRHDDTRIVLADFGLSIFSCPSEVLKMNCGTISYVAPEVLLLKGYSKMVDIWGVGVILFVLLSGELPFQGRTQNQVIQQTLYGPLMFSAVEWGVVSEDAKSLVRKLLEKNPVNRPTSTEAMEHPWFEDIRKKESKTSVIGLRRSATEMKKNTGILTPTSPAPPTFSNQENKMDSSRKPQLLSSPVIHKKQALEREHQIESDIITQLTLTAPAHSPSNDQHNINQEADSPSPMSDTNSTSYNPNQNIGLSATFNRDMTLGDPFGSSF